MHPESGEEAWINVVMGRIVNSNGQEVIQAVFTDITDQMRLEKAQEQEQILENRFLIKDAILKCRRSAPLMFPLLIRRISKH